jgi:hypothetical protein
VLPVNRMVDAPCFAEYRQAGGPAFEYTCVGFRVPEVPEPGTLMLLAFGGLAVMRRKR